MNFLTCDKNWLLTHCIYLHWLKPGIPESAASLLHCCLVEIGALLPSCSPKEKNHKDSGQENVGATWSQTCLKSTSPGTSSPANRVPIVKCELELHLAWRRSSGCLLNPQEKALSTYRHTAPLLQSLLIHYQGLQRKAIHWCCFHGHDLIQFYQVSSITDTKKNWMKQKYKFSAFRLH